MSKRNGGMGVQSEPSIMAVVDPGADIYTAFADHLTAFATAQGVPVAYPGIHFTPPTSGPWMELSWFPNETRNIALGNDGSQLRGFGQVSCCIRSGVGILPAANLAGEIIRHFEKGTVLGPARVDSKPWVSSVLNAPDRITAPVTVRYSGIVTE